MFGFRNSLFGSKQKNVNRKIYKGNQDLRKDFVSGVSYKKCDFINQIYEIYEVLGKGGFGVVYLVYSHENKEVYALKTFRDEYLNDNNVRNRFRKEVQVWINLEYHPYIVQLHFAYEMEGRIFIGMEYIEPNEQGLNSLEGHLVHQIPNLVQSLCWSIQFCYGMEHAYAKGINCHRDIKPANILISQDKTIKISDFGLAGALDILNEISEIRINVQNGRIGLSGQTMEGAGFGTPTHMPPEQFYNAAGCDVRSDIYSFGVVLYQMTTGGKIPFFTSFPQDNSNEEMMRFWKEMHRLHSKSSVPEVKSPLFSIIQHCLEKEPSRRYSTFKELRKELEFLLYQENGEVVKPPELREAGVEEWTNKGISFDSLGHYSKAIHCYNKALEINPELAITWNNKGSVLLKLGRYDEGINCLDKALKINPRENLAWNNKGTIFDRLGHYKEALHCFDKALEIEPSSSMTWSSKGDTFCNLGYYEEAIQCCDKALEFNQRNTSAWNNKGTALDYLGKYQEAIVCYDKVLEIDPKHACAWNNKALIFDILGRTHEAVACYDKAIEINPRYADAWYNKGRSFDILGKAQEAVTFYDKAIEIDPKHASAWDNKGTVLDHLGKYQEAIVCYDKVLEIDPKYADAWYNKGVVFGNLGRYEEEIRCYDEAIRIDPKHKEAQENKNICLQELKR